MKEYSKRYSSWFWRLLLSYCFVLILPVLLMFSFLNNNVFNAFEKQLFEKQESTLKRMQEIVDLNFTQLSAVHTEITLSMRTSPIPGISDVEKVHKMMNDLKHYGISTPWIYDIVVSFPDDPFLYTGSTSYLASHFFDDILHLENQTQQKLLEALFFNPENLSAKMYMLPMHSCAYKGAQKNLFPVICPFTTKSNSKSSTVLYLLDAALLEDSIMVFEPNTFEQYWALDTDKSVIMEFNSGESPLSLEPLLENAGEWTNRGSVKYSISQIDGSQFMLCEITSEKNGFTYLSAGSINDIYHSMNSLKVWLLIYTLFAAAIGALVIAYSMKKNYTPIRELTGFAKQVFPDESSPDEITTIHASIQHISEQYNCLKENSSIAVQNYFLHRLLQGDYTNLESLHTLGVVSGIQFSHPNFQALIIQFANDIPIAASYDIIQRTCRNQLDGFLSRMSDGNSYVYVANFPDSAISQLTEHHKQIFEELKQQFCNSKILLAVGQFCSAPIELHRSYETAVIAFDYRFVRGNDGIIDYQDLSSEKIMTPQNYPKHLFEQIRCALQAGETENFYPAWNTLIVYLKSKDLPLFYVRALSYELINILSESLLKLGNEEFSNEILRTYASCLSAFDTIDELIDGLNQLSMNLFLHIDQGILKEKDEKLYKIQHEIDTDYTNPNFSIQMLAEHHGMTSSGLSQYFKAQTGRSLMDYVTEKRMAHAQKLLQEGKLTLNEITEQIGYINTSSFIRRFKSLYGVTPRQYAATHSFESDHAQQP